MKTQKLNKTSLIMGGVILFIVAMLTIAVSSMVMSNANAEEEAVADSNISVHLILKAQYNNGQPIQGVKVVTYKDAHEMTERDVGETDQSGKIDKYMNFDDGVSYVFKAIYDKQELTTMNEFDSTKTDFNYTFKFTAPEPEKQIVTVTANGDESVKLKHADKWGTGDFTEAHQFTFECVNPENLTKEFSFSFQGVVIKEGDNALCSIKDNVDSPLTEDKVVQSKDKRSFTVDVNTSPVCTVNFKMAKGHEDKGSFDPQKLILPVDYTFTTAIGGIVFKKGETEKLVDVSRTENYEPDYWGVNTEDCVFLDQASLKDYLINDQITFYAFMKAQFVNEVTIVSAKPVYMLKAEQGGGGKGPRWTETAQTTNIIDSSHFGQSTHAIWFAPKFFSYYSTDEYGDADSGRVIVQKGAADEPFAFAYEKDENNLIPFEDMKVIEWAGPDNRTPKTISIGGATGDNSAQETAEGSAQTGDITYIAIAILACVGITSAVVAVRIRARRK